MQTANKQTQNRTERVLTQNGVTAYDGTAVLAYVNHGRWVADCACNGGELVAPNLQMVCGSCGARNTVTFPDERTMTEIVRVLDVRSPLNQNWHPDETVSELLAQNIENGLYPEDM